MERSRSYNKFDSNTDNNNYDNSTETTNCTITSDPPLTLNISNMETYDLRKVVELRQTQLKYQKQQHQHQHKQSPPQALQRQSSNSNSSSSPDKNDPHHHHMVTSLHRIIRKKTLQRQRPTELLDDADLAYAADLEEDEDEEYEEEEDDRVFADSEELQNQLQLQLQLQQHHHHNHHLPHHHEHHPHHGPLALSYVTEKHIHFRQHKPHSDSSLFTSSSASSSLPNPCPLHVHPHNNHRLRHEESFDSTTTTTTDTTSPTSPSTRRHQFSLLKRDSSAHSDSSRYSSVDSLLESRKPDPEAILINLGFGPVGSEDILSRIPKRFLKPSQVRGIDTDAFVKRLQLASNLADHSVLGYRGLTGNPDIPPSRIVAKIMQRFEVNERKKSLDSIEHGIQ